MLTALEFGEIIKLFWNSGMCLPIIKQNVNILGVKYGFYFTEREYTDVKNVIL